MHNTKVAERVLGTNNLARLDDGLEYCWADDLVDSK